MDERLNHSVQVTCITKVVETDGESVSLDWAVAGCILDFFEGFFLFLTRSFLLDFLFFTIGFLLCDSDTLLFLPALFQFQVVAKSVSDFDASESLAEKFEVFDTDA